MNINNLSIAPASSYNYILMLLEEDDNNNIEAILNLALELYNKKTIPYYFWYLQIVKDKIYEIGINFEEQIQFPINHICITHNYSKEGKQNFVACILLDRIYKDKEKNGNNLRILWERFYQIGLIPETTPRNEIYLQLCNIQNIPKENMISYNEWDTCRCDELEEEIQNKSSTYRELSEYIEWLSYQCLTRFIIR